MVGARWIMVTCSAPCCARSAQMSWPDVPEPTTTQCLSFHCRAAAVLAGMHDRAVGSRRRRRWLAWFGKPRHAGGEHEVRGTQRVGLAVAHHEDFPFVRRLVEARALAERGGPVVELHHLHVHLEPVGDAVLGREHRPVVRERQVRHVVVPDRVVQAERLVALAPGVAGALVLLHHERRHARGASGARRARCRPARRRRSGRTAGARCPGRRRRPRAAASPDSGRLSPRGLSAPAAW